MKFFSIKQLIEIAERLHEHGDVQRLRLIIVDGKYAFLDNQMSEDVYVLCPGERSETWCKLDKHYELVIDGELPEVLDYLYRVAEIDEEMDDTVPTLDELVELCHQWGKEKGLHDTNDPTRQTLKLVSEIGELAQAVIEDDDKEIQDALGDALVVIIQICAVRGYNINETLNNVYNIISKRKGKTVNGAFIKEGE